MLIPLLLVYIGPERTACAQQPGASAPIIKVPLSQEQVVENLVAMDLKRVHALNAFQGTQFYRLEYHGFGGTRSAEMTVDNPICNRVYDDRPQSIQKALTSGKGGDGSREPEARRNKQRQLQFHANGI
jgi:hypothetical protein